MRKLFLAILCCISATVFAQGPQGGFGGMGGGQFDPEAMVKRQADRLKESVGLNDEQYAKVTEFYKKQQEEMMKRFQEGGGQGQGQRMSREDMEKRREAQNAELKKILTEEQWKKYEEMQAQQRQRRGQGGQGQGGPRGFGDGFGGGRPQGAPQGGPQGNPQN